MDADEPQPETFGSRLRALRTGRGWSLADLARAVHYDKGYLSKAETGAKPPTAALVDACEAALDAGGTLRAAAGLGRRGTPEP